MPCNLRLSKANNKQVKKDCFEAYGGILCACCMVPKQIEFLTLDHVNNDGAQERKIKRRTGKTLYLWLRTRNFPDKEKYQVLCWDCNGAKGIYGICPHQTIGLFV